MQSSSALPDLWTRQSRWLLPGAALAVLALAVVALLAAQTPSASVLWLRWTAVFVLAWWLPGALLVALWRLRGLDLPAALLLAAALGLCWMILLLLAIHWWPGPIHTPALIVVYALGALVLAAALLWWRPVALVPTSGTTWAWLLALLVLASLFRLPALDYHEFHIDEVLVLSRARDAIRGEDDAFARHTKGPGELAMATVLYRTLGTANEQTARLPFGLASVASVLGLALLANDLFASARTANQVKERRPDPVASGWRFALSDGIGLLAGTLFALNGFALGLSRIVQYQAVVLLLMNMAALAAWRYARNGQGNWILLAGVLALFGLVMHYEFALIAPALLWLTWLGWQRDAAPRRTVLALAGLTLLGALLLTAVYLPTYLNPYFATTQYYLSDRMGALGRTFNGAFFVEMGTFYNAIYYFVGLLLLVVLGLALGWRWQRHATLMLALWFAPYLALYLFIVQYPGTHFYLLMPSWSILAALPLVAMVRPARRPALRVAAATLIVLWLAVSAHYLYLMFFRQDPEYLVNYPATRVAAYWAPYGDAIPEKPRFGFPIWEGWKTLGVLSEWGYLQGTYNTNERSRHLRWYLGDLEQTPIEERPDYLFVARHLQEREPRFNDAWLDGYARIGEVRVRDEPRIEIWARQAPTSAYLGYDAETFDDVFDGQAPTFREWPDPPTLVRDVPLGAELLLNQAGFAPQQAARGELIHLLLTWMPQQPLARDLKLFVHVADADGHPVAQWDGLPGLNTALTSRWPVGEPFRDHVLLRLPAEMAPGAYTVLAGLYDPASGERLGGAAIPIGSLVVR